MIPAIILHEAEIELWETVAYYEEKTTGLGRDFAVEIERTIQALCEAPERWPLREDGTRRCFTRHFPFIVVYAYRDEQVWVLAVAHCKRRPGYWAGRG